MGGGIVDNGAAAGRGEGLGHGVVEDLAVRAAQVGQGIVNSVELKVRRVLGGSEGDRHFLKRRTGFVE